ncbi:GNAT family N-acetyltransferase [Spirosoma harenae]
MFINEFISTASEQDIPTLDQLVNGAYRGERSKKGWTTEADLLGGIRIDERGLQKMFRNPQATILKYEEVGELLGCVFLETKADELYLGMLTVSPEAQAKGIGRKLLEAAELYAAARYCRSITITVIKIRHELIAWYERRGYQATGQTKPFPNDPSFGIPKQPLEFIVMEKVLE